MSLSLPEDAEPFIPTGEDLSILSTAGVYALRLTRPDDLEAAWNRHFENRPAYWEDLTDAKGVVYVGAAKNVLGRLTDHNDAEVRKAILPTVCKTDSIRNIWFVEDPDRRFIEESKIATLMQNEYPELFVHSR